MAAKHHSNNEDDFEEMGEEGILTPKNPEEMEFDDTELEEAPEPMEEE